MTSIETLAVGHNVDSEKPSSKPNPALSMNVPFTDTAAQVNERLWRRLPFYLALLAGFLAMGAIEALLTYPLETAVIPMLASAPVCVSVTWLAIARWRSEQSPSGLAYWMIGIVLCYLAQLLVVLLIFHDDRAYGGMIVLILFAACVLTTRTAYVSIVLIAFTLFAPTVPWFNAGRGTLTLIAFVFWPLVGYLIIFLRLRNESLVDRLTSNDKKLSRALQKTIRRLRCEVQERTVAEADLRTSELRYQSIFDNAIVGAYRCTADGRFTLVNKTLVQMLVLSSEKELTKGAGIGAVPCSVVSTFSQEVIRAANQHSRAGKKVRLKRANGETIIAILYASRITDVDRASGMIEGLVVDVTEREGAESRLRHLNERLRQASRAAAFGEVFAAISHEVCQPLFAISNFASASANALESKNPPPLGEIVTWNREIASQAHRGSEIIRRMRRLVSHNRPVQSCTSWSHIMSEASALIAPVLEEHGVELVLQVESQIPDLLVDELLVEQVLFNLIQNACHAMNMCALTDRILTLSVVNEQDMVKISVEDSGTEALPENTEDVFQPFFTTKTEGLGIGLAVCRTIVKAHGGRIWAVQNAIRGATLHLTLPVAKGELV